MHTPMMCRPRGRSARMLAAAALASLLTAAPALVQAQPPGTADDTSLMEQIEALRKQVSELQALMQTQEAPASGMAAGMDDDSGEMGAPSGGMPMNDMGEMGAMGSAGTGMRGNTGQMSSPPGGMPMGDMGEMGGMSRMSGGAGTGGVPGMGCMECMSEMGMGAMSGQPGMSAMPPASALPGFPGASHLYHVGADGFFVNHAQDIQLTQEQQTTLNQLKEKALLERATAERKIEEAEQQLYVLTGADQPDARKIEAQVRAIEDLRVQQRLAFIRAVGEAARVLTDAQRAALLGMADARDTMGEHE